jgi:hypothetical protein
MWKKVIWSDECSVEKSKDPRQIWVFRTPEEKWIKDCINEQIKSGEVKLMVWGCFAGEIKGKLVPLDGRINRFKYMDILEHNLPDITLEVWDSIGEEPIFMQDNAPVHTSGLVKDWLEGEEYIVMKWPPYSPDLNPIEQIWRLLKIKLQEHHPDIKHMQGGPETVKQRLSEVLPHMWDEIEEREFWKLVCSMPKRVQAVIDADGWYTKY